MKKYFVWRRDDGYVAATLNHMPRGWIQSSDGHEVTFEKLGEFNLWEDARKVIVQQHQLNPRSAYAHESFMPKDLRRV